MLFVWLNKGQVGFFVFAKKCINGILIMHTKNAQVQVKLWSLIILITYTLKKWAILYDFMNHFHEI